MTIESKFNVGQEVWLIYEKEAVNRIINTITSYTYTEGGFLRTDITYILKLTPGTHLEKHLFSTKKELLQSL